MTEEDRVRGLLAMAAEPEGPQRAPDEQFTARARRSLRRRRLAVGTGGLLVAGVVLSGVLSMNGLNEGSKRGDPQPVASAECVQEAAQKIRKRQGEGYRPVFGTVREGRIHVDDGVTQSSAFRFATEGELLAGSGTPPAGDLTVWYPTAEVQLPEPGRHLLLLQNAQRPDRSGGELFHFAPEQVLPLDAEGRVRLECADGSEGSVTSQRLRAAVQGS
ncbi:hypothetical protein O1Q96_27390 [Streptomyces sp. Qhu-G9]|uniref:hypothetical protein n=1 Tax=Streptomyces sp. Qhu-G9 TaxID=3452799 RepID=UPI0022AC09FC|nr:hypothetical protein [Streptomyces aurantiacus]WAU83085.1 hypothetical protein O1Q96_27390 [Streptomyces aurantiacus]